MRNFSFTRRPAVKQLGDNLLGEAQEGLGEALGERGGDASHLDDVFSAIMTKPTMRAAASKPIFLAIALSINAFAMQAKGQYVYENTQMGQDYKVYIYKKYSLGNGKWKFQTKAVYKCGAAAAPGCQPGTPYISEWRIADCWNATIDGKLVPARARFGYEEGEPEVFKSVCRL